MGHYYSEMCPVDEEDEKWAREQEENFRNTLKELIAENRLHEVLHMIVNHADPSYLLKSKIRRLKE